MDLPAGTKCYGVKTKRLIQQTLFAFKARIFLPGDAVAEFYSHVFLIPLLLVLVTGFLSYFGGYVGPHKIKLSGYAWSIIRSLILTVGILLSLLFFFKIEYVSRFVILAFAVAEFFVLFAIRFFAVRYFEDQVSSGNKTLKVLIVGTKSRARELR